ncbi:hypothetical protein [Noviherbaspirillum massiliense]|uniref:hypothetical protein n=1 Tax=Noviherbaspirillum massiliense TaxID=1465823 RepID=UPI00035ED226|nr:hypothetical protein [Noviherbaspirillum massiliense]
MIIDKTRLAGLAAYFQDPGNAGQINLANQVRSRTEPLGKGKQLDVSSIELLIESDTVDLLDLFRRQAQPLLSITVMKEMFPSLFADPFRHRVHNIAGFEDFKRGKFKNARALDVDGIPTIVSIGTGLCKWTSPLYPMPEPMALVHAAWELAASRKTAKGNFEYSLKLDTFDGNRNLLRTVFLANPQNMGQAGNLDPTAPRKAENLGLKDVAFYQVEFTADVRKDAALYEKHSTLLSESIGTPLLRAVNLLEPVEPAHDIHSLHELLSLASAYHLFEPQGTPLRKMLVTLELSATLVHSDYERIVNNDPDDAGSLYEFIEIDVMTNKFTNLEARLVAEVMIRPQFG